MKRILATAVFSILSAPSHGQQASSAPSFTQDDVVGKVVECMRETAPKDWRQLVFSLDQERPDPEDPGKTVASHKAAGKEEKALKEIKPCRRPDWVSSAVQRFRELQDEKARGWTGITISLQRDGHYTINYRYPKQ
jgi:hypothetical protein